MKRLFSPDIFLHLAVWKVVYGMFFAQQQNDDPWKEKKTGTADCINRGCPTLRDEPRSALMLLFLRQIDP